jgi:hypothetical protein
MLPSVVAGLTRVGGLLSKKRRRGIFQELNWFGLPFNPFLLAIGG